MHMQARTLVSAPGGGAWSTACRWVGGVWGVTRVVDADGKPAACEPAAHCWLVTHLPTGLSVTSGHAAQPAAAEALAHELFRRFPDWKSGAPFGSSPEPPNEMRDLVLAAVSA